LTWEMKTNKDGIKNDNDPHDADNTYTWYDSNPATNGGNAGTPGNGTDTEDFVKALNDAHYGGYSDWRLPTIKELSYIVNGSIPFPGPTLDIGYFPNTQPSFYWTATTYAEFSNYPWGVDFGYGYNETHSKDYYSHIRAVRGGQLGSLVDYTDNCDGTVTDTSTGLTWQQATSENSMTWETALSYCETLDLANYTDWRLPTNKELKSLLDYIRYTPAINTTFFPDTISYLYWSSTTAADVTGYAWGVDFYDGYDYNDGFKSGYDLYYVRAVRGGQSGPSVLTVSPARQKVAQGAGTTTFNISNTGTGTMPWTAAVTSAGGWLSITSGSNGSNSGTITCSYSANTTTSSRTATIRITATGATGSPVDVAVIQSPMTTACTATLYGNLLLQIPYISYYNSMLGTLWFWADFVYEFNPTYPAIIFFKLSNADFISSPSISCAASTLSDDFKIHIPDVLLPDGITHLWLDLEYIPALYTGGIVYFVVTDGGFVSN
jgi:hypothetical protein